MECCTASCREVADAPICSPRQLSIELAPTQKSWDTVKKSRAHIGQIIKGNDSRLIAIVGPCSIHDTSAALEYASCLKKLSDKVSGTMVLVMRAFLEKPRTSLGWRGLINDPYGDGSCQIESGLRIGRKLLLDITEMGLPVAVEMLDPLVSHYISDLVSWAAIGARTTESQVHRQCASSLSMPVGFKNGTSGDIESAVHAIKAASVSSGFLGVDRNGQVAVIRSKGNQYGHLILRGGVSGPNYDRPAFEHALMLLERAHVNQSVVVDCSHMNSAKNYLLQEQVWNELVLRKKNGCYSLHGVMLESNINEGQQPFDSTALKYGVSVTDGCIGWEQTEALIMRAHSTLQ